MIIIFKIKNNKLKIETYSSWDAYYVNQYEVYNLGVREMRNKIKYKDYEQLPVDTRNQIKSKDEVNIIYFVKNSILIKNSRNKEII